MELHMSKIRYAIPYSIAESVDDGDKVLRGDEIKDFQDGLTSAVNNKMVSKRAYYETMNLFGMAISDVQGDALQSIAKSGDRDQNDSINGISEINSFYKRGKTAVEADVANESDLKENLGELYPKKSFSERLLALAGFAAGGYGGYKAAQYGFAHAAEKAFNTAMSTGKSNLLFETTVFTPRMKKLLGYTGATVSAQTTGLCEKLGKYLPYVGAAVGAFALYKGINAIFDRKQPIE